MGFVAAGAFPGFTPFCGSGAPALVATPARYCYVTLSMTVCVWWPVSHYHVDFHRVNMCYTLSCLLCFILVSNPLHLVTLNIQRRLHAEWTRCITKTYSWFTSNTHARQATMHSISVVVTPASTSRNLQPPTATAFKPDTVPADSIRPS